MNHPAFFDAVPKIKLYNLLAASLGATEDGILQYGYFDTARIAGHFCPTIAFASVVGQPRLPGQLPRQSGATGFHGLLIGESP